MKAVYELHRIQYLMHIIRQCNEVGYGGHITLLYASPSEVCVRVEEKYEGSWTRRFESIEHAICEMRSWLRNRLYLAWSMESD